MRAFVFLILLFCSAPLWAAPNLGVYADIEGVRIYQDHEKANIWYPSPATPVVSEDKEKGPDFGLEIYRYLGVRAPAIRTFSACGVFFRSISSESPG